MTETAAVNRKRHYDGFSLVEANLAILVIFIIAGAALINSAGILPGMRANTAMHQMVAQLRNGREIAMAQRRNVDIVFLGDNQIRLVRRDMPSGTTELSTVTLEGRMEFQLVDGLPDTPDSFGNGSALDFSGAASLTYLSDGTLVDGEGNPVNGSVFMGQPGHPETARAVTILGATGRVRGYRWTGTSWIQ